MIKRGSWRTWRRIPSRTELTITNVCWAKRRSTYAQHDDRIRRLADTDGDGRADQSVVLANGFNGLEEGTGAGVLAVQDNVFFTCIPRLWKLVDADDDGVADKRDCALGRLWSPRRFPRTRHARLIRGYDGRLYFSIGDRGTMFAHRWRSSCGPREWSRLPL